MRQKDDPVADLLGTMGGPDLAVLHGFLPARADTGRFTDDTVISALPLMDAVAHGVGIGHAFFSKPETGHDHDVFIDQIIPNLCRDILQGF